MRSGGAWLPCLEELWVAHVEGINNGITRNALQERETQTYR